MGRIIPYIMGNIKSSKPPASGLEKKSIKSHSPWILHELPWNPTNHPPTSKALVGTEDFHTRHRDNARVTFANFRGGFPHGFPAFPMGNRLL